MHGALLKLIRLQLRGWARRQFTAGSTGKRVFALLGLIFFILWLGATSLGVAFQKPQPPEIILATLPFYITAFALLPMIFGNDDRAIAFTPAEIDFLFPGPFSRRHLVLYKMLKLVMGSIAGGLIFSLWMRALAGTFAFAVLGAVLSLVFINILTTVVALGRDILDERRYAWARRLALLTLLGGVGYIGWTTYEGTGSVTQTLKQLSGSTGARIITAPARVFAHVFAARSWGEAAQWSAGCLAMIVGAIGLVLALDKGYMEAALTASQRRGARLARLGRTGALAPGAKVGRVRLPTLTFLGGAGAIVRRQLITAVRASRGWIVLFVLAVVYSVVVVRIMGRAGLNRGAALPAVIPGMLIILLMVPQTLRFDFRSDLDHLDWLKSLPLSARAVAWAELATPVAIMTLMGWLVVGGTWAFIRFDPGLALMAALAVSPVAVLVIALENFVFLLMPTRLFTPGQASMQFSGRRILMALLRLLLICVGGGLVAGVGAGAWVLSKSLPLTYAACWLTLCAVGVGVVSAVSWAYKRFDVSADMPV